MLKIGTSQFCSIYNDLFPFLSQVADEVLERCDPALHSYFTATLGLDPQTSAHYPHAQQFALRALRDL